MADRKSGRKGRQRPVVELTIPSAFGWEQVAMDLAASVAERIGFSAGRIQDVRTAVSEATLNAIEHGNMLDTNEPVLIALIPGDKQLEIWVKDNARVPMPTSEISNAAPNLEEKLSNNARARGWGIFLIQSLTDFTDFKATETGNIVRMIIRREPGHDATHARRRGLSGALG